MLFFGYSFCVSCKYSSKIPSNCFVALFVLMLSFSDSKVEISSVFNDANRLKAILFTFQKYSVSARFLASCRPCWELGFDSVQQYFVLDRSSTILFNQMYVIGSK